MREFDVIIAGLGAMGSATAAQLANKGARVLGLDKFHPPHQFGSSHGLSRIIREAYFEHPVYVPLVQRAYELWENLQRTTGRKLLWRTGGLMIGPADSVLVTGSRHSAEVHKLPHKILSAGKIRRQFPAFDPPDDMVAVWEPRAGVLLPELAVKTHLEVAAGGGAMLKFDEPMLEWQATEGGVRVRTTTDTYAARQLLISSGAWLSSLTRELKLPLSVERQVLFWFAPRSNAEAFAPAACPIYILEHQPRRFFYGFPDFGDGVKIGIHHEGAGTGPDALDRVVKDHEIEAARKLLNRFLPEAAGTLKSSAVCMYTNTPDEHFILDFHPQWPQVLIASPCSGHGFKFAPVIGEVATTLLLGDMPHFDLSLFKLSRF
ncbi:MAG TPA: N-methyl-L-tryptophan oxidase [Candidatus Limnocylindrales bacterium]|jgi:sarcosine oxidase|nr:N-methyl-L-tryptophan oxidase [Candidatus Limnocylindrales bacterium]